MPWLLIIQVVLLVVWYTVAPTLPAWLVFFPMMVAGFWLMVFTGMGFVALALTSK